MAEILATYSYTSLGTSPQTYSIKCTNKSTCTKAIIPKTYGRNNSAVTEIASEAFADCSNLKEVIIPETIKKVKSLAFARCVSLESIYIPCEQIGSDSEPVFGACNKLKTVILGSNVKTISGYITTLGNQEVYYSFAENPPVVNGSVGILIPKIYVPEKSVEAYKSAIGWSNYADIIVGDDLALYFALNADQQKKYFPNKADLDTKLNNSGTDSFDGTLLLPQSSQYMDRSPEVTNFFDDGQEVSSIIATGNGETTTVSNFIDNSLATIVRISGDTVEGYSLNDKYGISLKDVYDAQSSSNNINAFVNNTNEESTLIVKNSGISTVYGSFSIPDALKGKNIILTGPKENSIGYTSVIYVFRDASSNYPSYTLNKGERRLVSLSSDCEPYLISITMTSGYENEILTLSIYDAEEKELFNSKIKSFESIGWNRFDINSSIKDYILESDTGLYRKYDGFTLSDFIDITVSWGGEYRIMGLLVDVSSLLSESVYVYYYNSSKNLVHFESCTPYVYDSYNYHYLGEILNYSNEYKYARIAYSYENWKGVIVYDRYMANSPSEISADRFYPYKKSKVTFNNLELGKWDYVENGKIYRHTLKIELDGTENWVDPHGRCLEANLTNKLGGKNFYGGDMYYGSNNSGYTQPFYEHALCAGYNSYNKGSSVGYFDDGYNWITAERENVINIENNLYQEPASWVTYLQNLKQAGKPLTVYVHTIEPYSIEDFPYSTQYQAFIGGTEQLLLENGKNCSITRYYKTIDSMNEAANKGYVNTVAANKLDVNGGSMEGPLHLNDNLIISKETDVLGTLNVAEGTIMLPNSSQHQSESNPTLFNETEARITGGKNKSFKIIDGSDAHIVKITGDTIKSDPSIIYPEFELNPNDPNININSDGTVTLRNNCEIYGRKPSFTAPYGKFLFAQMEVDPSWYTGDPNYPSYLSGIEFVLYNNTAGVVAYLGFTSGSDSNILTAEYYHYEDLVVDFFCIRNYDGRDIKIKNIRIKLMDSDPLYDFILPPYVEPFDGLKHVEFSGVKSTGRNLIPYPYKDNLRKEMYGITFTVNDDRTVTLNGTATANSFFYLKESGENALHLLPGTYHIGGERYQTPVSNVTVRCAITENGSTRYIIAPNSFTLTSDAYVQLYIVALQNSVCDNITIKPMLNIGSKELPYEPYIEHIVKYDSPLKLGKWDYVEDGKIYEGSKTLVFNGKDELKFGNWMYDGPSPSSPMTCWYFGFTDTTLAALFDSLNNPSNTICDKYTYYNSGMYSSTTPNMVYQTYSLNSGNYINCNFIIKDRSYSTVADFVASLAEKPMTIRFKLKDGIYNGNNVNKLDQYPVYEDGTEQLLINSEEYGFNPSIEVVYLIEENPTEAATKAYVNNGLVKKLDKTGGLIQGSLLVDGTIQGKLSSIVVTNGETTYGLAYDGGDDTFKLGQGSYSDSEKVFEFKEGEGLPIALRDDDSKLEDNSLLKYSKDGNKLTDSGVKLDLLLKLLDSLTLEQVEALNEFAKSLTLID